MREALEIRSRAFRLPVALVVDRMHRPSVTHAAFDDGAGELCVRLAGRRRVHPLEKGVTAVAVQQENDALWTRRRAQQAAGLEAPGEGGELHPLRIRECALGQLHVIWH